LQLKEIVMIIDKMKQLSEKTAEWAVRKFYEYVDPATGEVIVPELCPKTFLPFKPGTKEIDESLVKRMEIVGARITPRGLEITDPIPHAVPIDFQRPLTLEEMVDAHVKHRLNQDAMNDGIETPEDVERAFDALDDSENDEFVTPYEASEMAAGMRVPEGMVFNDLVEEYPFTEEQKSAIRSIVGDGSSASPQRSSDVVEPITQAKSDEQNT
jgi:hypothetical protein